MHVHCYTGLRPTTVSQNLELFWGKNTSFHLATLSTSSVLPPNHQRDLCQDKPQFSVLTLTRMKLFSSFSGFPGHTRLQIALLAKYNTQIKHHKQGGSKAPENFLIWDGSGESLLGLIVHQIPRKILEIPFHMRLCHTLGGDQRDESSQPWGKHRHRICRINSPFLLMFFSLRRSTMIALHFFLSAFRRESQK